MERTKARPLESLERILVKFVNLPARSGSSKPAEEFAKRYGKLASLRLRCDEIPFDRYHLYVALFRRAWTARTRTEKARASQQLEGILNRHAWVSGIVDRPALNVDLASTRTLTLKINSDTHLLDLMVWTLIRAKRRLAVCKRAACAHPYFIKPTTKPRRKHCCVECSGRTRREGKALWWRENRGLKSAA